MYTGNNNIYLLWFLMASPSLSIFCHWMQHLQQQQRNTNCWFRVRVCFSIFFLSVCVCVWYFHYGVAAACPSAHSHTFTHRTFILLCVCFRCFDPFNNIDQFMCIGFVCLYIQCMSCYYDPAWPYTTEFTHTHVSTHQHKRNAFIGSDNIASHNLRSHWCWREKTSRTHTNTQFVSLLCLTDR